jgi:hypothetical protein
MQPATMVKAAYSRIPPLLGSWIASTRILVVTARTPWTQRRDANLHLGGHSATESGFDLRLSRPREVLLPRWVIPSGISPAHGSDGREGYHFLDSPVRKPLNYKNFHTVERDGVSRMPA